MLDPYKPYILERWQSGCWNGTQLYHEVKMRGYTGSDSLFRLFISQLRKQQQRAGTASVLTLDTDGDQVQAPLDSSLKPSRHPSHVADQSLLVVWRPSGQA